MRGTMSWFHEAAPFLVICGIARTAGVVAVLLICALAGIAWRGVP